MFYAKEIDRVFRFGDVVRGFAPATPILEMPLIGSETSYSIKLCHAQLAVVLSPCCSIDNGILALAPLQQILPAFCRNPWLVEDFTRINRKMSAEKSVPPNRWASMPQAVKERELDLENDAYAFTDFFVYAEDLVLPKYTVHLNGQQDFETRLHMIDFKTAYRVNCNLIKRNSHPIDAKLLQLSRESRGDLRNKIAAYFARVPDEDMV